jgi:hypothetical protein
MTDTSETGMISRLEEPQAGGLISTKQIAIALILILLLIGVNIWMWLA